MADQELVAFDGRGWEGARSARLLSDDDVVKNWKYSRELDLAAVETLKSGRPSGRALPDGVRVLDSWHAVERGAILFWIDRELDLYGIGEEALYYVSLDLLDGLWQRRGSGGQSASSPAQTLRQRGTGLHRLGGGSRDPVRLTVALGSPEVCAIELRNDHTTTRRQLGVDGFCLLGITHHDPITYAFPLDAGGTPLPGDPLLL